MPQHIPTEKGNGKPGPGHKDQRFCYKCLLAGNVRKKQIVCLAGIANLCHFRDFGNEKNLRDELI